MKRYEHLSGAEKRKRRAQKQEVDAAQAQKHPKILSFFNRVSDFPSTSEHQDTPIEKDVVVSEETCNVTEETHDNFDAKKEINKENNRIETTVNIDSESGISEHGNKNNLIESIDNESSCSNYLSVETLRDSISFEKEYPTDRGHFGNEITNEIKKFIINNGPCKPRGPFPKDQNQDNRSFSIKYYETQTKTGLKISREWLCYSQKKDAVYCEACWLFAERKGSLLSPWADEGVRDWKGLSKKIDTHEKSAMHLNACRVSDLWRKDRTVDAGMKSELKQETNKWVSVLDRIVNVTLTLAGSNLAFRGHTEVVGKPNSGNFLAVIDLLSKYDPVLEQIVNAPKYSNKYMSPAIQNELINLLSTIVQNTILKEIESAQFFSIIMDTTQDITKTDQLSQIIRYVSISKDESGRPTSLETNERFLGFREVSDQTGQGLEEEIIHSLEEKNLMLSKCRGQGYDGAANMSGVYQGVKSRIERKQKTAKYIHCAAHNLNLVLNDAISNIQENKSFFDVVGQIYVFFSQSIKRWELLCSVTITLKKLCPTRWSSRIDSLKALRYNFVEVLRALTTIVLSSNKPDEKAQANALKSHMESFEFVVEMVSSTLILESTDIVSKYLQRKDIDVCKAMELLKNVQKELTDLRNNYDTTIVTATAIAQQWGVNTELKNKRNKKSKKHFDELAQDERLADANLYYKTVVFYGTLDIAINQITFRFEGMSHVANLFSVLSPEFLLSSKDDELQVKSSELAKEYSEDLTSDLPNEMLSFRRTFRHEIKTKRSLKEMAEFLFLENYSVASSLPNLCTAYLLFLTLPVTVASAQRSFSKLKLIKNYLRSTMSQERLSGLSVLSIENDIARKIDVKTVIETFAAINAARSRHFK